MTQTEQTPPDTDRPVLGLVKGYWRVVWREQDAAPVWRQFPDRYQVDPPSMWVELPPTNTELTLTIDEVELAACAIDDPLRPHLTPKADELLQKLKNHVKTIKASPFFTNLNA